MIRAGLGLAICVALTTGLLADGLAVSPAIYHWFGVVPGREPAKILRLNIINKAASANRYKLSVIIPPKIEAAQENGYLPLPDAGWVKLGAKELAVAGNSSTIVPVTLKIPNRRTLFGRSYLFYIEVKEKVSGNEKISLACFPKVLIKTVE